MKFMHYIIILLCLCPIVLAAREKACIEAGYEIDLIFPSKKLEVTAHFTGCTANEYYIGFTHYLHYGGQDKSLIKRFNSIRTKDALLEKTPFKSVYKVIPDNKDSFTLRYTLDPSRAPSDHHLSTLTDTVFHLPGKDFFIKITDEYPDEFKEKEEFPGGFSLIKSHTVTINDIPDDWSLLTTNKQPDSRTVVIDDRPGYDVLINAGQYDLSRFTSGTCLITLAFDTGLTINRRNYIEPLKKVFEYYYAVYRDIPDEKIVMVVHQDPVPKGFSIGGQVKDQNIIITISMAYENRQRVLQLLAHEAHHIWLSHGFYIKPGDNWYWFQEGITDYMAAKSLVQTGTLPVEESIYRELNDWFDGYINLSIKDSQNLVRVSVEPYPNEEQIRLFYDKGALVASLLDNALEEQGSSLEEFLGDFYRAFSRKTFGGEIGNSEIITFINEYLDNPDFSRKYITGTEPIDLTAITLDLGWLRIWWSIEKRYLPPVAFPFNLLSVLLLLILASLFIWQSFTRFKLLFSVLAVLLFLGLCAGLIFLIIQFVHFNLYLEIGLILVVLYSLFVVYLFILKRLKESAFVRSS